MPAAKGEQAMSSIDYEWLYFHRFPLLRKAFSRFKPDTAYEKFLTENEDWLTDYCLFMAIKDKQGGISFAEWPDAYRNREPEALEEAKAALKTEMDFTVSSSMNSGNSGISCMPMPTHRALKSLATFPFMWHLTAPIPGQIRNYSR